MTDLLDYNDIRRILEREAKRRPYGESHRCDRCWFWELGRYTDEHPDDRSGECHRQAPQVPMQHVCEGIGRICWAIEEIAKVKHEKDFDYEFGSEIYRHGSWPSTTGNDWCGDFKERPIEQTEEAARDRQT
jgi:hypothetical protein